MMRAVLIPVAYGDAADRITILTIKNERIKDEAKLDHVSTELALLSDAFFANVRLAEGFDSLFAELKSINEALWQIEDDIRACESRNDFGDDFIRLARAVYLTNDRRAQIKRAIDELLGSELREEKSYASS
jgi:Family of unknown function (DUF6165)